MELADGLAKLLTRFEVFIGGVKQHIHATDRLRGNRGDTMLHDPLDQWQSVINFTQHCFSDHSIKVKFGSAQAIDGRIVAPRKTIHAGIDEEDGNPLLVSGTTASTGGHDNFVRRGCVENHTLLATQHIIVTALFSLKFHIVQVETRLLFSVSESHLQLAFHQFREQTVLQCLVATIDQEIATDNDAGQIGLNYQPTTERFHNHHGFDRPATIASIFLRQRRAQPSQFGHFFPVILAVSFGRGNQCSPFIELVFLADETVDAILEQLLFFAE